MFTYLHYICFKFSDLCDRMGDTFKCIKCNFSCSQFAEMIDHMIVRHPDDEIVFRKLALNAKSKATVWQTKTFPVTPSVIKDKGSFIYSIPETEKIKIEKLNPTDVRGRSDTPYICHTYVVHTKQRGMYAVDT